MKCAIRGFGWVAVDGFGAGGSDTFKGFTSGELPQVQRKDLFDRPDRRFGRMDPFSRLGLAAITFALRDADLDQWQDKRSIGILAETYSGCLYTDGDYFATVIPDQGAYASPQLFAYTLSNTFLGEAAIRFGLTGNCQVVNSYDKCGLSTLQAAMETLSWSEDEKVIVGYCDLGNDGALNAPGALFMVLEAVDADLPPDSICLHVDEHGGLCCQNRTIDSVTEVIKILVSLGADRFLLGEIFDENENCLPVLG